MKDLKEWIQKLKEVSKRNIILVESKKDKEVLEEFDIQNIWTLKKPLYNMVEDVVNSKKGVFF